MSKTLNPGTRRNITLFDTDNIEYNKSESESESVFEQKIHPKQRVSTANQGPTPAKSRAIGQM